MSLVAAADAEACVCDLTEPVGLSQPTVSHHLKILVDAGVLQREQRGKWAYYKLVPATFVSISRLLAAQLGLGSALQPSCRRLPPAFMANAPAPKTSAPEMFVVHYRVPSCPGAL